MNGKNNLFRLLGRGIAFWLLFVFFFTDSGLRGEETPQERIVSLEKRLADASDKDKVAILAALAAAYRSLNVQKAVENGLASWKLAKKIGDREGEAAALAEVSQGYTYASDYVQAEKFARLCLASYQALNNDKGKALGLNAIGNALFKQERLQEALGCFSRSLQLRRQIKDLDGSTSSLMNISQVYFRMNRFRDGLPYLMESERLARQTSDQKQLISILCTMGIAYQNMAQYDQAMEYFRESLRIAEDTGDRYMRVILQINIGCCHLILSQFEPALESFEKSLKMLEDTGSKELTANATYNIGVVYDELGQYGKALDYYRKALDISRSIDDKRNTVFIKLGMGEALISLGEFEKAAAELQQAIESARSLAADDLLGEGWFDLGELCRQQHRLDDAGTAFNKALKTGEAIRDPALIWKTFYALGQLREEQGNLAEAVRAYKNSIRQIEDLRVQQRSEEFRTSYLQQKISVYEALASLLIRRGAPADLQEAFAVSERARARSFLDLLLLRKLGFPPEKMKFVNPLPLKLAAVQRLLSEDEKLIEYLVTDEDVYVFVVGRRLFQVKALGSGRQKLQEAIFRLRSPFEEYKQGKVDFAHLHFDLQTAHELYQELIAPIEECLSGGEGSHCQLIIVPDDTLYYLPFEALAIDSKPGRPIELLFSEYEQATYLIQRYPITYSFSASMLDPQWRRMNKDSRRVIAFGNPAALARKELPLLPKSGDEVAEIQSLFGAENCAIRTKDRALESAFKKEAGKFDYIHIATHGIHSPFNPLQSRLYFTAGAGEDGILYVDEIYNLKLNCRLVTLSACETGLGDLKRGEGMLSLARAFLHAGASQVISSLWSVEESAYPLIIHFYENLKQGASPAFALRQAKLAMIVRRQPRQDGSAFSYALPFLWAPFILVGR